MTHFLRALFRRREKGDITVGEAMVVDFARLTPDTSVAAAMEILRSSFQREFPVVENGRLVGTVRRRDLNAALLRESPTQLIRDLMERRVPTALATELLDRVLARWPLAHRAVVVVQDDAPIGMLDRQQLRGVGAW